MQVLFGNKLYDALKWIALVVLPAAGALYLGIANVWNLPFADQVNATIIVVVTFLGVLLGVSTKQYNDSEAKYDGSVNIEEDEEGIKRMSLDLDMTPEELAAKKDISFKVKPSTVVSAPEKPSTDAS